MKASGNKGSLHWGLKILVWINILNSLLLLGAYLNTHVSPNSISYLSYLGLAYPIWLTIALISILFWVFVRRKYALISLITLLIGWNHLRHFFVITVFQPTIEQPIKVVSFNVHVFDMYDLENRIQNRDDIISFLKDESPDIMCFQEFYHENNSVDISTRDTLISALATENYYEGYTHDLANERYFGLAIITKYPIIRAGEIKFDNDPNNNCIYTDLVIETDTVRVFNAHLGSIRLQSDDYEFFGDNDGPNGYTDQEAGQRILKRLKDAFEKRAIQAELVAAEIDRSPYPVIFCGDLNDTPVSYCYRQFSSLLYDAFVGSGNGIGQTYIGKVPSNRIDYIFHDENFESANFTTHQVELSDHKPISTEIGFVKD